MANLRVIPLNFFDECSSLTATSEVTGMEIANAQTHARSEFWRSTSAAAQTIQGAWSAGRDVNAFAAFRHNAAGATLRLQLYSASNWTSEIYDSTALTVSSTPAGSFDWGNATTVDPRLADAPYVLWLPATYAAQSFRITTGGTPSSGAAYFQAGRLWLGKYFEATHNMAPGLELQWINDSERRRSRGGSLRSRAGSASWRRLALDLRFMNEADRQTWTDLEGVLGHERDLVVSAFPASGGRVERDYTLNAKFEQLDPIIYQYAFKTKRVVLEEI